VGVWETVGTLGVPELDVAGFKLFSHERREYSFVNTEVAPNVEYAFHALALDEERKAFSPTVWESPKAGSGSRLKLLKQCWFPGVHSSVGGGQTDTAIANISLAWMMTQLQPFLSFDPDCIPEQYRANESFYTQQNIKPEQWAMGQIVRSDAGAINTITGRQVRTPGQYHVIDPNSGHATDTPLSNTCEFVHPSVRYRVREHGPGLATSHDSSGKGSYQPLALDGWTYIRPGESLPENASADARRLARWGNCGKWLVGHADGTATVIVEETIENGCAEMELLQCYPGTAQALYQ
jgi:hypothetical protein